MKNRIKFSVMFMLILSMSLPMITQAAEKVAPSVRLLAMEPSGEQGYFVATGWLIDENTVATAAHVVSHKPVNYADLGDDRVPVTVAYTDKHKDIAFLEIGKKTENQKRLLEAIGVLPVAKEWKLNSTVDTVGYPYISDSAETWVRGILRNPYSTATWADRVTLNGAVEYDSPITSGFSGGPAINSENEVVGMILGRELARPTNAFLVTYQDITEAYEKYKNPPVVHGTVISTTK